MRPSIALILAAATVATWPTPGHAQWKWRDDQGRLTLSDRPPPASVPPSQILARPSDDAPARRAAAPAAPAASQAKSGVDAELDARRRKVDEDAQAKRRAEEEKNAAVMKDTCARARNNLATLESGQRIVHMNDKGEREVVDDTQREAEMTRTRDVVASSCKS